MTRTENKKLKLANPREHSSWGSMIQRCNNKNTDSYKYYGGRGIGVCSRWTRFNLFLADMGARPLDCTLERKNSNKDYEPGNCRWATIPEQNRNKRNNVLIEHDGSVKCLSDWAREVGLTAATISRRINGGLNVKDALTVPVNSQNRFLVMNGGAA